MKRAENEKGQKWKGPKKIKKLERAENEKGR